MVEEILSVIIVLLECCLLNCDLLLVIIAKTSTCHACSCIRMQLSPGARICVLYEFMNTIRSCLSVTVRDFALN